MDLKIDGDVLKTVMQEALMRQLKDVDREALIAAALAHLMTPERRGFSDGKSPLTQAFEWAAEKAARETLAEEFKKPEQVARMTELVSKALDKILSDPHGAIVAKMADAFSAALTPSR